VFAATVEAATDAVAFVALHAQAKRQVAGGDGIAEGIGALGPVGEAADFITQPAIHLGIITFEFCGEERRKNDKKLTAEDAQERAEKTTELPRFAQNGGQASGLETDPGSNGRMREVAWAETRWREGLLA
jgi:hypothetical protein